MFDILLILQCLNTCMDPICVKRLKIIVPALLAIPGRMTMLSISRWTGEGGSYRSVQRFFNTIIDWKKVQWSLIRQYFQNSLDIFILAGDETVVTKSVKKRKSGRPKGSTNKVKENVELSPYLKFIQNLLLEVMLLIGNNIQVKYGVFDGAFGHYDALQMVRLAGLHLISKLKKNSKLYFPYDGAYSGQ